MEIEPSLEYNYGDLGSYALYVVEGLQNSKIITSKEAFESK